MPIWSHGLDLSNEGATTIRLLQKRTPIQTMSQLSNCTFSEFSLERSGEKPTAMLSFMQPMQVASLTGSRRPSGCMLRVCK